MRRSNSDETSNDVAEGARASDCDYLELTRQFWQPYADRELTREDAREMAHNLIGYFTVLREWSIRDRRRARRDATEPTPEPEQRTRKKPPRNSTPKDKTRS